MDIEELMFRIQSEQPSGEDWEIRFQTVGIPETPQGTLTILVNQRPTIEHPRQLFALKAIPEA